MSDIKILKKGLASHLMMVILSLVLLPSIIISAVSYKIASEDLYTESLKGLTSIANLQISDIGQYVDRVLLDLEIESERLSNVSFLETLIFAFEQSNLSAKEFVASYEWATIIDDSEADLRKFGELYDYYDIFFIDTSGNILFNLTHEDDLGSNLINGEYANTLFAAGYKKSLNTGQATFSDFEFYQPSDDAISSFFVNVMLDENGDKIGLIAFQSKHKKFESGLLGEAKDSSIYAYILGSDFTLRTNPQNSSELKALETKLEVDVLTDWFESNQSNEKASNSTALSYQGINGKEVLGVFHALSIADKKFILVAEESAESVYANSKKLAESDIILLSLTLFFAILLVIRVTRSIVSPIVSLEGALAKVASGDLEQSLQIEAKHELASLSASFVSMVDVLRENKTNETKDAWQQEGASVLNEMIRGEQSIAQLSRNIIRFYCEYLGVSVGAFYQIDDTDTIHLMGSYAFTVRKNFANSFQFGEGMVGQAVLEQQMLVIENVPSDYLSISSGLGSSTPRVLSIIPLKWDSRINSVIELGSESHLNEAQLKLISSLSSTISIALNSAMARDKTQDLLSKTQTQAEQLKAREEELSINNEMLVDQSQKLEKSAADLEEKNYALQTQQEELTASNEELEIKTQELQRSGAILEEKNNDLDVAQLALVKKADDLAASSRYKSEFLANMSHELRTPLNSLLILAKLLADNRSGNLSEKEIEFASTIHDSGTDLLNLINDILDLSKIEAGHMDVLVEPLNLEDFITSLQRKFQPLTDKKEISLTVENELSGISVNTDGHKLGQIVKNLMSNAIKFTAKGGVTLKVSTLSEHLAKEQYLDASEYIQISVKDTGIGLKEDSLLSIFGAFQQADGSTSRKFGGTGLGLSISRELSKLLGGGIFVESVFGQGSEFYVLIKRTLVAKKVNKVAASSAHDSPIVRPIARPDETLIKVDKGKSTVQAKEELTDDRHEINSGDRSILIIEDDVTFAKVLQEVARESGFKTLIAEDGEAGLHFADYYKPSGIILDIGLPGIDGWTVIDRLKANLDTRHIPVHFMSGNDKTIDAFQSGAVSYMTKPVSMEALQNTMQRIEGFIDQPVRKLLIIEDNEVQSQSIIELIGEGDVQSVVAGTGQEAIELLKQQKFDCIVLDLGLPDMDGGDLLEMIRADEQMSEIPVVVYSGRDLNREEKETLEKFANRIIIKNARSPEMLLDDTAIFLHRVLGKMPKDRLKVLNMLHDHESVLEGRQVLVVDDDMRNIFALTTMLRDKGMEVTSARNGIDALQKLDKMESPDIVLMDIMMPEMDGYEAMQKIREKEQYDKLPIIALTAKAMKGDRGKCIEAGANDYLSKPIDTDKLISMMRVWLYR